MDVTFDGTVLRAGTEARERFYDSRGYGRPRDGELELAPVEAAHLLFRGDLEAVLDRRPDTGKERLDFHEFLASSAVSEVSFFVYAELRERGFYLSPVRDSSPGVDSDIGGRGFEVYPRGHGPWDGEVAYYVRAVSEREDVSATALRRLARIGDRERGQTDSDDSDNAEPTGVLAVVDEESEVTYLELGEPTMQGSSHHDLSGFEGRLLSDRVLVTDPPEALYDHAFYGKRLSRDERPLQLSLVEAAYLTDCGVLTIDELPETDAGHTGHKAVLERGREVEGERFDRRLRVYSALRTAGIVPKTGFKFGADFRTYADVSSVEDLGHSELLVRVLPEPYTFSPRDLALDVRLAHGVRKQMVFALALETGLEWLTVERLTP